MWNGVELREIRVFLTLAEELHFGRSAERLGITHARVSQTLRTLEARVGARLFDRTSRSVRLTPIGEELERTVGPAFAQLRRAYEETVELATGVSGTLRLGLYAYVAGGPHLMQIIKTFETRHPSCKVQLRETGLGPHHFDPLRRGEHDLIAMRMPL